MRADHGPLAEVPIPPLWTQVVVLPVIGGMALHRRGKAATEAAVDLVIEKVAVRIMRMLVSDEAVHTLLEELVQTMTQRTLASIAGGLTREMS